MYSRSAYIYRDIYESMRKDYQKEVKDLQRIISRHSPAAKDLLDVGCGNGAHLGHLQKYYSTEGLDISEEMIRIARERLPGMSFHVGDMVTFKSEQKYDVITCLFSSIGYVKSKKRLGLAITNLTNHLRTGGLLIIEPWLTPETFEPRHMPSSVFVDKPDLKILRANFSEKKGSLSKMVMHYLVVAPHGIEYFNEKHHLGLFYKGEYIGFMEKNKLSVIYEEKGLTGRGLFIGLLQKQTGQDAGT